MWRRCFVFVRVLRALCRLFLGGLLDFRRIRRGMKFVWDLQEFFCIRFKWQFLVLVFFCNGMIWRFFVFLFYFASEMSWGRGVCVGVGFQSIGFRSVYRVFRFRFFVEKQFQRCLVLERVMGFICRRGFYLLYFFFNVKNLIEFVFVFELK